MKNKFIIGLILLAAAVLPLSGSECFSEIRKEAAKCEIYSDKDYELGAKLIKQMKQMALERKPVLEKPHTMMEGIIYRYARLYHTENSWFDRQLFVDRTLWEKSTIPFKKKSIARSFEIMNSYGVGCSYFYTPYFKMLYACAEKIPGFKIVPAFFLNRKPYQTKKFFDTVRKSPAALKVNGKAVLLSYGCDRSLSPKQFKEHVEQLKKISGKDDFMLVAEFTENCHRKNCGWNYKEINWPSIHYLKTGKISARHMLYFFDLLTEYLESGGGIDLAVYAGTTSLEMSYKKFDDLLLPLCGAACGQPKFNGKKLLSLQIMYGYITPHGAQTLSPNGTKTARNYLELCKKYKVDIPMGFEWDELNEATNWEPTVARPMALRRIFRHYQSTAEGKTPEPLPGDDLSVPNMIISQRRQLPMGTPFELEVLNVPDGKSKGTFNCTLELLDHAGKVRWNSGNWNFDAAVQQDKKIVLASENFADAMLLAPRLTVRHNGKTQVFSDGLPFTVLRAGYNNDQSWFATPLRNVLKPEGRISFKEIRKLAPGVTEFELDVDIKTAETLSAAEAVQNSYACFAYDKANEYLQNDKDRYLYRIFYRYLNTPYKQEIRLNPHVANAPSLIGFAHNTPPNKPAEQFKGSIPEYKLINGVMENYQLFSVKKSEIPSAVLKFTGRRAGGPAKDKPVSWELPLAKIGDFGIISKVFEDGLAITVERSYRHARLPLSQNTSKLCFKNTVICDTVESVLALRLISKDGKIYWSRPVVPVPFNQKSGSRKIHGYDNRKGKIQFSVPENRIHTIDYNFTPEYGNILTCAAGREFYAHAGSYTATSIAFNGQLGSWHTLPFILLTRPKDQLNPPAPEWVKESDGSMALDFDGKNGNFIAFPYSIISPRCGFDLAMEILPRELKREQIIFRQYGPAYQTGFCISHKKGKLQLSFRYRNPQMESSGTLEFATGLQLKANRYQKVGLRFDGETAVISLDGKEERFTCPGVPYWASNFNFGGDITKGKGKNARPRFFNGRLKSFKVSPY